MGADDVGHARAPPTRRAGHEDEIRRHGAEITSGRVVNIAPVHPKAPKWRLVCRGLRCPLGWSDSAMRYCRVNSPGHSVSRELAIGEVVHEC